MTDEVAQQLVEQGYLSYDDLSVIEPDALMEMGNWSQEEVDAIVYQADVKAEEQEIVEEERKYQEKLAKERRATEELDRKEGRSLPPPPVAAAEPEVANVPEAELPSADDTAKEDKQTDGNV
jgi:N utilization substance protein A